MHFNITDDLESQWNVIKFMDELAKIDTEELLRNPPPVVEEPKKKPVVK